MTKAIRVLLADDVPANLRALKRLLTRRGCDVELASDGQEAVQRVRDAAYDIVLLDIQMPKMDGLQACQAIRELPNCRDLPIFAMSARAAESDRAACQAAGMTDCLPKPVDVAQLFQVIENIRLKQPVNDASLAFATDSPTPVLDRAEALARLQDDSEIYSLFIKQFEESATPLRIEIETAARVKQLDAVAFAAHKLRGISANLSAKVLQCLTAEIERAARSDDATKVSTLLPSLVDAIADVKAALAADA